MSQNIETNSASSQLLHLPAPLSLDTLTTDSHPQSTSESTPRIRRSKRIVLNHRMPSKYSSSFKFELIVGSGTDKPSILKKTDMLSAQSKNVSWSDAVNGQSLSTLIDKTSSDIIEISDNNTNTVNDDSLSMKNNEDDSTREMEVDSDDCLMINDDEDNEKELIIDEVEEVIVVESKSGIKRRKREEKRKLEKEAHQRKEAVLLRLDEVSKKRIKKEETDPLVNDTTDADETLDALVELVNPSIKKKISSKKESSSVPLDAPSSSFDEAAMEKRMKKERQEKFMKSAIQMIQESNELGTNMEMDMDIDTDDIIGSSSLNLPIEDIPDISELVSKPTVSINSSMSNDEPKQKKERVKTTRTSKTKGEEKRKVRKDETEEEIRMRKEQIVKKKIELAKKRKETKLELIRERREMRKREKEREEEEKEKKRKLLLEARTPRSRAEAKRITKKILEMELKKEKEKIYTVSSDDEGNENNDKIKKRRRSYRRKQPAITKIKRSASDDDDEVQVILKCGTYLKNPCVYKRDKALCTTEPEVVNYVEEEDDKDDLTSVPISWRNDEEMEMMIPCAQGPINYDPDEDLRRHRLKIEKFSEGITDEYRKMVKKMDSMKKNVFGDTTIRKFDPRILHNINHINKASTWPRDLLPKPGVVIPKYECMIWRRPFNGLVRLRARKVRTNEIVSHEINNQSNGGVNKITSKDVKLNLRQLIDSKLNMTKKWNPLEKSRNPYDIPELTTRTFHKDGESVLATYVEANANVIRRKVEPKMKNHKKGLKSLLSSEESIYVDNDNLKEVKEEDEWNPGFNEMGEWTFNNNMQYDPFSTNEQYPSLTPLNHMEIKEEEEEESYPSTSMVNIEEETQLGGAFSFVANHL